MTDPETAASGAEGSALLTDLYQLTMLDAYRQSGVGGTAVFELFVRRLPPCRGFLLVAGLDPLLAWLEGLRFTADELDWLRGLGRFSDELLASLADLRFTGTVHAMPEGTVAFAHEPLVQVTAPLAEAQLIESRLLSLVHLHTLLASKAARCVLAAGGRRLVDFGMRRAHGAEAALAGARAAWIAGFDATATVLAGRLYGIPLAGTMAHSYVQVHASERAAFESFALAHRDDVTLLIDTWDTAEGARTVAFMKRWLAEHGIRVSGVRIDSGDLTHEAWRVRRILDEAGMGDVAIVASGGLDEHDVAAIVRGGAPVDAFGIGSRLDTSADAPYLDCAYKLVEHEGRGTFKRSEGKATLPCRKQVFRRLEGGVLDRDVVALAGEAPDGEPLLVPVMEGGRRLRAPEPLSAIRERARAQLASLPDGLRALDDAATVEVRVSHDLRAAVLESPCD